MPLPLILPAVPPTPELADVMLVSAAGQQRFLELPRATVSDQIVVSIVPTPASPDLLYLAEAALLLPLAQAESPESEPFVASPDSTDTDASSPDAAESAVDEQVEDAVAEPSETEAEPPPAESAPPLEEDYTILLRADRQTFEPLRQIVTATGDVLVQFGTGQLAADRLWLNLTNRYIQADGNVFFSRNNQILEGDSATYNLLQGSGTMENGRGELQVTTLEDDFSNPFLNSGQSAGRPLDYRLQNQGSISQVTSTGRVAIATSDPTNILTGDQPGELRRLRFQSDRLYFDAEGWYADELRLTNDPFSPPELEFRASNVRLTPLNAEQDELVFSNPRLVLDQGLTIPLFRRRFVLTRGQLPADELNPLPTNIGIDGFDRGGLFIERELPPLESGPWRVSLAPQFLISRWLDDSDYNLFDPANFGLVARIDGSFGPRTFANANFSLSGFDLDNINNRLRASFRAQQLLGTHLLNLEYSYRDRLFNGSLGFQDVQDSLGALLESPNIVLGNSGLNLNYQVSGQYVTANTDQPSLLGGETGIGLTNLFRFQGAADLSRSFLLWQGQPLPATQTQGLRYSDRPLVPNLILGVGLQGVVTYYSSNDVQESVNGRIALSGQVGHLQRNSFDYTQFNIGFSHNFIFGEISPFLFDRIVDQTVLSGGIIQQIYGPFLAGFQTAINLETGSFIDSNLVFEYRRRAYGLLLSYSPTQETGFLGFRISTFDWIGRTAPFDAPPDTPSDVVVQ